MKADPPEPEIQRVEELFWKWESICEDTDLLQEQTQLQWEAHLSHYASI